MNVTRLTIYKVRHILVYDRKQIDIKYNVLIWLGVMVMVFNTTFNNISAISWRSVFIMEKTVIPGENHRGVASH